MEMSLMLRVNILSKRAAGRIDILSIISTASGAAG